MDSCHESPRGRESNEGHGGTESIVRPSLSSVWHCWDSGIILWGTGYTLTIVQWARFCVFDLTMRPWCCAAIVASSASASLFLDIFVPRMIIILYPGVLPSSTRKRAFCGIWSFACLSVSTRARETSDYSFAVRKHRTLHPTIRHRRWSESIHSIMHADRTFTQHNQATSFRQAARRQAHDFRPRYESIL
jgi:hypothetical protein